MEYQRNFLASVRASTPQSAPQDDTSEEPGKSQGGLSERRTTPPRPVVKTTWVHVLMGVWLVFCACCLVWTYVLAYRG